MDMKLHLKLVPTGRNEKMKIIKWQWFTCLIRIIVIGIMLTIVYKETGPLTVTCFAILFIFNEASTLDAQVQCDFNKAVADLLATMHTHYINSKTLKGEGDETQITS